jgi:CDP-glucose 4,6-dehydratase
MNSNFWRGKRVFLTGHTGFKGSWLSLWLQHLGARLHGFGLAPHTTPALFELGNVSEQMDSEFGDVRDLERLTQSLQRAAPEIVFHMAALPIVSDSFIQPVETYHTNVMGTVHLLEAVRKTPSVKAVVVITSDKCYENREWLWGYREDEAMGGLDPYSSSKGCAELVVSAYRRSFFQKPGVATLLASVRAGNVIGGGDWAKDRLIPDMMRALVAKQTIKIRQPRSIRPWQHVLEPLYGYMSLAQHLVEKGADFAEGWNFGPTDEDSRSVEWVANHVVKVWGGGRKWELDANATFHEAYQLKLDSSKARARLGWQPSWDLHTALEKVADWYKGWDGGEDVKALCLRQIQEYTASVPGGSS